MTDKKKWLKIALVIGVALLSVAVYVAMTMAIAKRNTPGVNSFFVVQAIVFLVLTAMVTVVFYMILLKKNKKLSMEKIYLIVGLGMGIVFVLMMPLMTIPDEHHHMVSAYDISDYMMGTHDNKGIVMRVDDASRAYNPINLSLQDYINEYKDIFTPIQDKTLETTLNKPMVAPRFLFIVPAIGITIGRLLGLGTTLTFLLGRLCNMLLFVLAVYYAIKKMPFAKGVVFVWALLPMTLHQTSSFSYDAPIQALVVLIIALTLDLAYGKEQITKADRKEIILLAVFCLLLLPCKGFALLPIVVLPLMLLPRVIRDHKNQLKAFYINLKPWIKYTIWAMLGIIILGVCFVGFRIVRNMIAPENINHQAIVPWTGEYAYSPGYFITRPWVLAKILLNSVGGRGDRYLQEMIGGSLGWLEIPIPWMFLICFMFLFVYAGLRRENEKQLISTGARVWMLFLCAGACLLVLLAMLFYWTPSTVTTIEGVQGRYFLPALLLAGICLRTRKTCVSEDADKYVMLWAVFMQIIVVAEVFKNILEG